MNIKPFNKKLVQLAQLLSDGNAHSGSELGAKLNVTRSAVWKMIKKLEGYGVFVHPSQSRGYILDEPLLLLDPNVIQRQLVDDVRVTVLESISSTNDYFKLTKSSPHSKIECCLAEEQTKGRGRHQRSWHSPFGKNIYLSCYYPIQKDISELAGLSLVIGLAVRSMLKSFSALECWLKWPNDLLCHEKKIAGILIDVQAESHSVSLVTIGIGLNVNTTTKKKGIPQIEQPWTSLHDEKNELFDRNKVAVALIQSILKYVRRFEQHGLFVFMEEWKEADILAGKKVILHRSHDQISGTVFGINDQGHLLLKLPHQRIESFSSGDVSLNNIKSA